MSSKLKCLDRQELPSPTGLSNSTGSMCWCNALIQSLATFTSVKSTLQQKIITGPIEMHIRQIFSNIHESAFPLLQYLEKDSQYISGASDVNDALDIILDRMLSVELCDLFKTRRDIITYCTSCGCYIRDQQKPQYFTTLQKNIPEPQFKNFMKEFHLSVEDFKLKNIPKGRCCEHRQLCRQSSLRRVAEIVTFIVQQEPGNVYFPAEFRINSSSGESLLYEVVAIIMHTGGHYTCRVLRAQGWFYISDSTVSKCDFYIDDYDCIVFYHLAAKISKER